MATIPSYDSQQQLATGALPQAERLDVSSGLAAVGEHMTKAAMVLYQQEEYNAHVEASNLLALFREQMYTTTEQSRNSVQGNADGFTRTAQEQYKAVAKDFSKRTGNTRVQEMFDIGAANYAPTYMQGNISWEHGHNKAWAIQSITERAAIESQQIYRDPNMFRAAIGQMRYDIENMPYLDQKDRNTLLKQNLNNYTMNLFIGMADGDPGETLKLLLDQEGFNNFMEEQGGWLDGQDRAKLVHYSQQKLNQKHSTEGLENLQVAREWWENPNAKTELPPGMTQEKLLSPMSQAQKFQYFQGLRRFKSKQNTERIKHTANSDELLGAASEIRAEAGLDSATAKKVAPYFGMMHSLAQQYGVDPVVGLAIMGQEAAATREGIADPTSVSQAGAKGLMQVMPQHWKPGQNPFDPETNIRKGLEIFSGNMKWANGIVQNHPQVDPTELALSAYNGGQHDKLKQLVEQYGENWKEHLGDIKRPSAARENYDYIQKVSSRMIGGRGVKPEQERKALLEAYNNREKNPGDESESSLIYGIGSAYTNKSLAEKVYSRVALQRQNYTNLPATQYEGLTTNEAKRLVGQINMDPDQGQQVLEQLKSSIVRNPKDDNQRQAWAAVQRSLYKNGLNETYSFKTLTDNTTYEPLAQRALVMKDTDAAAMLGDREKKKEIDDYLTGASSAMWGGGAIDDINDFKRILSYSNGSAGSEKYLIAMDNQNKKIAYLAAAADPSKSAKEIVNGLAQATISDKVSIQDTYYIPKTLSYIGRPIQEAFVNEALERAKARSISSDGTFVPSEAYFNKKYGTDYSAQEMHNSQNHVWINTPDGSGVVLGIRLRDSGHIEPILDKQGKQMRVTWEWLMSDSAYAQLY